ncbi:MAG: hypothetical protein EOO90_11775 [Pedobacter sp.]|nr:MAG: hypothetical protein EOO90_11775 [Pedobacter sp.]
MGKYRQQINIYFFGDAHRGIPYFRQNTGKEQAFAQKDHADIANNYINPMADFLSSLFNISLTDATCLAWNGVADSDAFVNATTFTVGTGPNATTISKEDMAVIATNYTLKLDGKGYVNKGFIDNFLYNLDMLGRFRSN